MQMIFFLSARKWIKCS